MFLPGPGRKGFAPSIGKISVPDHILVAVARSPESVPLVPGAFVGPPGARLDVACRRPSEREVLALRMPACGECFSLSSAKKRPSACSMWESVS